MGQARNDLRDVIARYARAHRFSERERELLLLAASGVARCDLARQMDLAEPTIKTLIRRMLAKRGGGVMTLQEMVGAVLRELFGAIESERAGPRRLRDAG